MNEYLLSSENHVSPYGKTSSAVAVVVYMEVLVEQLRPLLVLQG